KRLCTGAITAEFTRIDNDRCHDQLRGGKTYFQSYKHAERPCKGQNRHIGSACFLERAGRGGDRRTRRQDVVDKDDAPAQEVAIATPGNPKGAGHIVLARFGSSRALAPRPTFWRVRFM